MKIEVSLDFLLREWDFCSRIAKCSELGISGVEVPDWGSHEPGLMRMLLEKYDVELVVLPGDSWVGDPSNTHVKFPVTDSKNRDLFFRELDEALAFARTCDARNILLDTGDSIAGVSDDEMMRNVIEALGPAADKVKESGMGVLIEPLNRDDHKGYFLYTIEKASKLATEIGAGTRLLIDMFHSAKEEKDALFDQLRKHRSLIGEVVHVADVPHRQEPGKGDTDWASVMKLLSDLDFNGWIGFEFVPSKRSEEAIADCRRVLRL